MKELLISFLFLADSRGTEVCQKLLNVGGTRSCQMIVSPNCIPRLKNQQIGANTS
jgi:hypothetical protein